MSRTSKDEGDRLGAAIGQLLAIAGAFGLLGLLKDQIVWEQNLGIWIDAFRAFTRPIASILFGWIPALLHVNFPGWAKDYLTVGLITGGTALPALPYMIGSLARKEEYGTTHATLTSYILIIYFATGAFAVLTLAWPLNIIVATLIFLDLPPYIRNMARTFFSAYIYAILIIAMNYAFSVGRPY